MAKIFVMPTISRRTKILFKHWDYIVSFAHWTKLNPSLDPGFCWSVHFIVKDPVFCKNLFVLD